jgi:hypothetical protein
MVYNYGLHHGFNSILCFACIIIWISMYRLQQSTMRLQTQANPSLSIFIFECAIMFIHVDKGYVMFLPEWHLPEWHTFSQVCTLQFKGFWQISLHWITAFWPHLVCWLEETKVKNRRWKKIRKPEIIVSHSFRFPIFFFHSLVYWIWTANFLL